MPVHLYLNPKVAVITRDAPVLKLIFGSEKCLR
jgi:hypothetical protein